MGAIGRPPRPKPDDFEEVFVRLGWDAAEHYGTHSTRVARWVEESDRDKLKRRRRNYVLGTRLSSLNRVVKTV
jgi:hypothetical protein